MLRTTCSTFLALGLCLASVPIALSDPGSRSIVALPPGNEALVREAGFAIWSRQPQLLLGGADGSTLTHLAEVGIAPLVQLDDDASFLYLLHHRESFTPPAVVGARMVPLAEGLTLYLFDAGRPVHLPRVKPNGGFQGIPRLPLPAVQPHPADIATDGAVGGDSFNPLVSEILSKTSQANWFQMVKDLSGENPVDIGGQSWTISTRYTDSMFPTPQDNAHATEYLEDRGAQWGYSSHRESYTSAESGCSQGTWQNLIFVVPGQVDFGKHQQVLFVNHYDSLSFSDAESRNYSPGADDAISGGVALLEAMRTFKDYAFKNTLVFGWYTGEEEGICGSEAYSHQHPNYDMWRVVNMDQTAFDGDGNRIMNVYNWDPINSPASVAEGDLFVQTNSDYGNIIDPSKIVRDQSKMCQTDHCPFWDIGVPAIAVLEDLHNNDICPCFDQSQSPTCHDTVTQIYNGQPMFTQDFSWPSQKAAIAVIAQMAEPLFRCPAVPVAAPSATSRNNAVVLQWGAAPEVTRYVVERAATCAGPFEGIASVSGTSYEDETATNGSSYAYRIRTCSTQISGCTTSGPVPGASVKYQQGSAAITADSGDHDLVADNCELTTVRLNLVNDGTVPLSNVRLAAVTVSDPAARIASAVPQLAGSLAVGATVPVSFKFYLGRDGSSASCGLPLTFRVTATADQAPASTRSFDLNAERSIVNGPLSYGFETDLSGWTVVGGTFTRAAGGAPGSPAASLHSGNNTDDCNGIQSPIIKPTASTTMQMYVNYDIEAGSSDRANMRAVDLRTGEKRQLTPTSGATYNTGGNRNLLCDNIGNQQGWSGKFKNWRPATFDLSAFAGREIRLEARYSTDGFLNGTTGFWFDNVTLSNVTQIDCDGQTNSCAALPAEVSPTGAAVPLTIKKSGTSLTIGFAEVSGAVNYNLYPGTLNNLRSGVYDHAAAPGLCGFTDSTPGDGKVTVTVSSSSIPAGSYLLAVAVNAAGESRYGTKSDGSEIPLALNACP